MHVFLSSQKDHSSLVKDRDEKLSKLTSKLHDLETKLANAKKEMNESTQALTTLREEKMEHAYVYQSSIIAVLYARGIYLDAYYSSSQISHNYKWNDIFKFHLHSNLNLNLVSFCIIL